MANAPQRLSVSAVTKLVKRCLEDALAPLWVEGEISNFVAHTSGHFYFSMKDAGAQLRCVMFRGANQRLRFRPEDGIHCAAFGRITVYESRALVRGRHEASAPVTFTTMRQLRVVK